MMNFRYLLHALCCLVTAVTCNPDAKRLYDDLIMKGYNNNVRPAADHSQSVIIHFSIRLAQIVRIDEVNGIMTLNLWVEQEWIDQRFIWESREYNNISMLFVPANKLWLPDIVLYNNADGDYTIPNDGKATIYPSGKVLYNPPFTSKSSCEIDVQYFPFDTQKCHLKFGPWTYDQTKVDILHLNRLHPDSSIRANISDAVKLDDYQRSVEWDLINVTAVENSVPYPCCPDEPFADLTFYIEVRRKHLYYVINLVIPCMSMNILTILAFYLPSYSGEKIGITISVFLSLSLFQLVLFDLTPSTSLKLPLIGKYILVTSLLVTASIMLNTVILNMNHRMSSTHQMSRFVRWLFLGILSRLLYMRLPESDENTSPLDENMRSYKSNYSDMSHYGNPDQANGGGMLHPQLRQSDISLESICKTCHDKRLSKYPPTVVKGLDGISFLAKHYKDEDENNRVIDEWRYVALIADRVLLWIYIIISLVITMEIFMNAPSLYSDQKAIG